MNSGEEKIGRFTHEEEVANFISHFAGAVLAGIMLTLMVVASALKGNAWHIVSTAIFGSTMVLLYFSSAVAHGLPKGKGKQVFFIIDQAAIFLLIAGTYTPLALVALHGAFGWVLFGLQWAMAISGILIKVLRPNRVEAGVDILGILIYAVMGWMLLIAIIPIIRTLPLMGFLWIMIGGACYTLGIIFYRKAKFKHAHLVWHLMVLAGSISHFFAILFYVIPISV
ncbi:MAG: hemolysin III family protein [Marinilabiliaceae bacterium]|jgi:hemolysin III|nr:hemolysin III family protein [Marinilabiliaceae bacterium]